MNKRRILFILLAISLAVLLAWFFLYRNPFSAKEPLSMLPSNPVLVLQFADQYPAILTEEWPAEYQGVPLIDSMQMQAAALMEHVFTLSGLHETESAGGWLAAYTTGQKLADYVLVINVDPHWEAENLQSATEGVSFTIKQRKAQYGIVNDLVFNDGYKFSFFKSGSLLVCSNSSFWVENVMTTSKKKEGLSENESFNKLVSQYGKTTQNVLYIQLPQLASLLEKSGSNGIPAVNQKLKQMFGWVAITISEASHSLVLHGYAIPGENEKQLLVPYLSYQSNASSITDVFPANTMYFWERNPGVSPEFLLTDHPEALQEYEKYFKSWSGNHWATVATLSKDANLLVKSSFVIACEDPQEAYNRLEALSDVPGPTYMSVPYNRMASGLVLNKLAGFNDSCYYAALDDYMVFSKSLFYLKSMIDSYKSQQSLLNRKSFQQLDSLRLSTWSQQFYFHLGDLSKVQTAMDGLPRGVEDKWSSLLIQLNAHQGLYVLNGFLVKNSGITDEVVGTWVAETQQGIAAGPFVVPNHLTGTETILVQDSSSILYHYAASGELLWTRQLNSVLKGEITPVDIYNNQRIQLLCATQDAIHLIDLNGNDVEGFPIVLTSGIASGVSAVDYDRNGDYRMFVGGMNGNIYGFYKNGKPLPGWKPLMGAGLSTHIRHFITDQKDFLYYANNQNQWIVKNRKGENRFPAVALPSNLLFVPKPNRINEPDLWLSLTGNGELFQISLTGATQLVSFTETAHQALAADIDLDGQTDVVYINDKGVFAVNLKGEVLYSFDPGDPLSCELSYLDTQKGGILLVHATSTKQIFALNADGSQVVDEPFEAQGKTAFLQKPNPMLVVAGGRLVQCYEIK